MSEPGPLSVASNGRFRSIPTAPAGRSLNTHQTCAADIVDIVERYRYRARVTPCRSGICSCNHEAQDEACSDVELRKEIGTARALADESDPRCSLAGWSLSRGLPCLVLVAKRSWESHRGRLARRGAQLAFVRRCWQRHCHGRPEKSGVLSYSCPTGALVDAD